MLDIEKVYYSHNVITMALIVLFLEEKNYVNQFSFSFGNQ